LSSIVADNVLIQKLEAIQYKLPSILSMYDAILLDRLKSKYTSPACKPSRLAQPVRLEKPIIPELKTSWFGLFFSRDSSLANKTQALDESACRWGTQNIKEQVNY
jgi:hypothetical protein